MNDDMKTQEKTNLTTYSDRITSALYLTKVTASGGCHSQIRSEEGLLDLNWPCPVNLAAGEMLLTRSTWSLS
jgi:hypothetical protein